MEGIGIDEIVLEVKTQRLRAAPVQSFSRRLGLLDLHGSRRHAAPAEPCRPDRDGRRPHRQQRPRARCADGPRCYARHKRARRRLERYERSAEPVVRDHDAATRREARARERQHEWLRRGARARRGRPRPTAARPGRRADTAGHRTAPLPTPRGACATPCGASTRAQPGPREPGDAALTRSRRGRRRRPQPRAGPELEAVGPPPVCLPDGKQVRDDRPRWRPVPATEPPQPILSEAADVTTAPAQARPGPRLASALPGEFGLATPSVRKRQPKPMRA